MPVVEKKKNESNSRIVYIFVISSLIVTRQRSEEPIECSDQLRSFAIYNQPEISRKTDALPNWKLQSTLLNDHQ